MDLKKFNGFKLVSLEVHKHKILGTNVFNFLQEEDNNDSIYSTILIGPNGTGKSEILKLIINVFRNLSLIKNGQKAKNLGCLFKLKFKNKHEYTFSNYKIIDNNTSNPFKYNIEYTLERYDVLIDIFKSYDEVDDYQTPNITASSFMLSDKFFIPITDNDKSYFNNYNYLGLKSNRQSGSTQRLLRRTVDHIVDNENPEVFQKSIKKIGKFLELDSDGIEVSYKTKYTNRFWNGDLTPNILEDFFHEITVQYEEMQGKTAPFKLTNYRKLKSKGIENIESLCNYMNQMSKSKRLIDSESKRSQFKTLTFNIAKSIEHQRLGEEKKIIEYAINLGFLETPQINFISSSKIPIDQASSGEINLFATMIGLISTIKYGSLIIIDEPEVSLHPNWQMKYLHFLTELLNEYNDSHILIATHSHFLISDLQGDTGKIIGLKKEKNEINTIDINANTFGWSAEEVLYKIFDVRTTRNHYLEMDLRKMLSLVAEKSKDKNQISEILERVKEVQLDENDPLRLIVNQVEKYL